MTPQLGLKFLLFFTLFFVFSGNVYGEKSLINPAVEAAKIRANEFCEMDPTSPKCEKLLNSRYRKMKDSEKEVKDIHFKHSDERRFTAEKLSELRAFCRINRDSPRCESLKSHR